MKKIQIVLMILILGLAFMVRLYRFDNPIGDWHAWRQADTSAVSRNFVKSGFDMLHPRFDDLSNVPSGRDNPNGYRFVEFPIYNFLQAGLFRAVGIFTLEQWGRLVTIFATLISILFIYLITKKYAGIVPAFFAAGFFAFNPFSIYYGRVILPDPSMVMASLGGIYFFDKWLDRIIIKKRSSWVWYFLSLFFTISALLIKPYALFFAGPIIYLIFYKLGLKFYKTWQIYIYLILAVTPLILWRVWMTAYPEGIPVSDWLFNGGNIRFTGAYFYWIFAERIGKLIFGYWGLILFGLGFLFMARKKILAKNMLFLSFIVSSLLYLIIMARGNVQHDYYQILIMPSLSMFFGLGCYFILTLPKDYYYKYAGQVVLVISIIFSLSFSWYYIRDFFNINNPSLAIAGRDLDKLLPERAKVIAIAHGSEGDTTFLYAVNRQGWTSFQRSLPEMITMGADYLIFSRPTIEDLDYGKNYKIVKSNSDYLIIDLHKK